MKAIAALLVLIAGSLSAGGQNAHYKSPHFTVLSDGIVESPCSASVVSPTELQSNYPSTKRLAGGTAQWRVQSDISAVTLR